MSRPKGIFCAQLQCSCRRLSADLKERRRQFNKWSQWFCIVAVFWFTKQNKKQTLPITKARKKVPTLAAHCPSLAPFASS